MWRYLKLLCLNKVFRYILIEILIFVLFYVLFVCICVLYYCHRVATQLQLTNTSYHTWKHAYVSTAA